MHAFYLYWIVRSIVQARCDDDVRDWYVELLVQYSISRFSIKIKIRNEFSCLIIYVWDNEQDVIVQLFIE